MVIPYRIPKKDDPNSPKEITPMKNILGKNFNLMGFPYGGLPLNWASIHLTNTSGKGSKKFPVLVPGFFLGMETKGLGKISFPLGRVFGKSNGLNSPTWNFFHLFSPIFWKFASVLSKLWPTGVKIIPQGIKVLNPGKKSPPPRTPPGPF